MAGILEIDHKNLKDLTNEQIETFIKVLQAELERRG
jgi:hypothetical protein